MAEHVPTFEEIDKHIQAADLSAFQPGGKHHVAAAAAKANPAAAITSVCPAYKIVKPILLAFMAFPFFPAKWKDAIKAFMGVLDLICM
jgi:hypothetical protein